MKALILALAVVGLTACAHSPTVKKEQTMTQAEQQIPGRPVLTPPEVLTKALDFIRTAQSPEDFNITKAEEVMKLKFLERTDRSNRGSDFHAGNKFGDSGWRWTLGFKKHEISNRVAMDLHFSEDFDAPATPVCQMDLNQFRSLLEQAGFTYVEREERPWPPSKLYEKGYPNGYRSFVDVVYRGESREKNTHDCIRGITFYMPIFPKIGA